MFNPHNQRGFSRPRWATTRACETPTANRSEAATATLTPPMPHSTAWGSRSATARCSPTSTDDSAFGISCRFRPPMSRWIRCRCAIRSGSPRSMLATVMVGRNSVRYRDIPVVPAAELTGRVTLLAPSGSRPAGRLRLVFVDGEAGRRFDTTTFQMRSSTCWAFLRGLGGFDTRAGEESVRLARGSPRARRPCRSRRRLGPGTFRHYRGRPRIFLALQGPLPGRGPPASE